MAQPALDNVTLLSVKPSAAVVTVDPSTATRWLGKNHKNRGFRQSVANGYARDMAAGRWHLTGAPIQFGQEGQLLDGQHRLSAVIQSGVTVQFFVVRGLDADSQHVMDTGAKRTVADALGLNGYSYAALTAATVKRIILIEDGRIYQNSHLQSVSTLEIMNWIDRHPDVIELVRTADGLKNKIDAAPTAVATAMWITNQVDRAASAEFWSQLANRTDLPEGSPILAIDSRLREIRRNWTRATHRDLVSMFIRGWNAWRRGKSMRVIPLASRDGRIPDAI